MLWTLWSLSSLLRDSHGMRAIGGLCLFMPFVTASLYKTFSYLEDGLFMYTYVNVTLCLMTISLLLFVLLASWYVKDVAYFSLVLVLGLLLLGCFLSSNLLLFYVLFEASLLPILYMIIGWGYQPERMQAGLYMVMYTVVTSMPLFAVIIYLYVHYYTWNIFTLAVLSPAVSTMGCLLGCVAFMTKLPVYGLHVWLPKAHVEAPLGGSMLLAGVLLKLGGYGLYLYVTVLTFPVWGGISVFFSSLALWGGVLAAWVCFSQNDIKAMIAYSSIVHMSVVVLGLFSLTTWGLSSATITMLAHGWVSSGLFLLAYVTYLKVGSRSFSYTKGMLQTIPTLSAMWFLYCIWNMAVPPTINLLGELAAVPVSFMFGWGLLGALLIIMFLAVGYNMYLYMCINHGPQSDYLLSYSSIKSANMLPLVAHFGPLILLFNIDILCPLCGAAGGRMLLMSM